jgi:hypothetical protein
MKTVCEVKERCEFNARANGGCAYAEDDTLVAVCNMRKIILRKEANERERHYQETRLTLEP